MFEAKKFISKAKPLLLNLSKKSKIVVKNLIKKAKQGKISKEKVKKIINALDESKVTKTWLRTALLIIISGLIVKKISEIYDEEKSFKQNIKKFLIYAKKLKKRIKK
ncbi:MAG: hypothetical protein PHN56_04730 [Candidatus Nanoarchaeia archaeon]|nr:hypothetical protein [Candidatus Nanoarchaeia archaeon]